MLITVSCIETVAAVALVVAAKSIGKKKKESIITKIKITDLYVLGQGCRSLALHPRNLKIRLMYDKLHVMADNDLDVKTNVKHGNFEIPAQVQYIHIVVNVSTTLYVKYSNIFLSALLYILLNVQYTVGILIIFYQRKK